MQAAIEAILRELCNLDREKPVLVGVSGGPDSLCLLSVMHEAGYRLVAAHFNHGLRPEADGEAMAVEAIAAQLGIPFVGGKGDVRQHALDEKLSIESAARQLRYGFLFTEARRCGAQAVAVGHTADDQVETVLMHLLRGAGLGGLKGMAFRSFLDEYDKDIPLIRPLLDTWRSETVSYCGSHKLVAHYDASNDSLDYTRNRVRHELIPSLESYNPRFREAVWRTSRTLAADHALLSYVIEPAWQKALKGQTDDYVCLDLSVLCAQPAGLQMHLIRRAAKHLIPGYDTGFDDLQRAAAFLGDAEQERTDFAGGLILVHEADLLYVTSSEDRLPSSQWPQMPSGKDSLSFSPPAEVALAGGWKFSAMECEPADLSSAAPWQHEDSFHAFLDIRALPQGFVLRVREAGDRFEPLGMEGHSQKLSDFLVNSKLPSRARERWPLVCAGKEIIWVPGYRPADRHQMREDSKRVLRLAVTPPGS